jgi:hypothetical protein
MKVGREGRSRKLEAQGWMMVIGWEAYPRIQPFKLLGLAGYQIRETPYITIPVVVSWSNRPMDS